MDDIVKKSLLELRRKTDLFIKIIKLVPNQSVWGLGEISEDVWKDFKGFDKILEYRVESEFEYNIVVPEVYIELNPISKNAIIPLLDKNIALWGYIYHQMIFKDSMGYFISLENFDVIDICDNIGFSDNEFNKYKSYGFDIRMS